MRRLPRWIAYPVGLLAASVVGLMLLSSDLESFIQSINPSTFDSMAWRQGNIRARGTMVDDLTDRGRLVGKTREEVLAMLGPPDRDHGELLFYVVDMGQRFGSTPWTYGLRIYFDPKTGLASSVFYTD